MVNFLNLPTAQAPRNALMDFSPVNNAIDGNRRNALAVQEGQRQDQELTMRKDEQTYQRGRDQKQDAWQQMQRAGQMADAIQRMPDTDPAKAAAWQRYLKTYGDGDHGPEELDFRTGPKLAAAAVGKWNDPREDQMKNLELQEKQARLGLINAQAAAANRRGSPDVDQRLSDLKRFNIDPNSPEGQMYVFNGKLPSKAYENKAYLAKQDGTVQNIEQGLTNLNAATQYDDTSFTNAVGPIQGSTPDGLLSSLPVNAARLFGEVNNWWDGGKTAPSEVRSRIVGDTEALAAAIKPLIRKPGEGVWTDQDQARLVSIVGDLSQARDKDEYRRRLNNVRDRVRSNFGLDITFDAGGGQTAPSQAQTPAPIAPGAVMQGYRYKGGNPADPQSWERQ